MIFRPRSAHYSLLAACALVSFTYPLTATAQPAPPQKPASTQSSKPALPPSSEVQKSAMQWDVAAKLHTARKYKEAIAAYNEFIKTATDGKLPPDAIAPAYQNLSAIYRSQGKTAELLEALKSWSALVPGNAALHAELS